MKLLIPIPFIVFLVVACSWITNLIKFMECDFQAPYKYAIIHGVGIIPPVAVVTVWFGTDKDKKP